MISIFCTLGYSVIFFFNQKWIYPICILWLQVANDNLCQKFSSMSTHAVVDEQK